MRHTILYRVPEGSSRDRCLKNSTKTPPREFTSQFSIRRSFYRHDLRSTRTSQVGINPQQPRPVSPKSPKTQVFYAVVLHDFVAERADELDAKAGDPISVVAQSNREWFVAKPIGRLGRPGLIPVTFVEVRDPASNTPISDIEALMDRGDLPRVEDWKRAMFNYKQSSIPLGVLDEPNRESSVANSPYMPKYPPGSTPGAQNKSSSRQQKHPPQLDPPPRTPSPTHLPQGILLAADVVSFHYEMEEYWFRIDATFQPYNPANPRSVSPAKQLVLFRVYNDFYDFQVNLLNTFPREAGREPPAERILPYMPGPAQRVDDEITASRRAELDEYLHKLCELNHAGAKYILEHSVVREFLALKPGDVENQVDPRIDDIEMLYGYNEYANGNSGADKEYENEMRDTLGNMMISGQEDEERSEGSDYDDDNYTPDGRSSELPSHRASESQGPLSLRQQAHAQNHQRTGSVASSHLTPSTGAIPGNSPYRHQPSSSQAESSQFVHSSGPSRSYSPSGRSPLEDGRSSYSNRWPDNNSASPPSSAHSKSSSIARSRSHSNAGSNLNNPPISAANSQTAFVKIKIFDRVTDDLIALRVHPRVSHGELMDKVQARLGGEVMHLRYRDSLSNEFIGLDDDDALSDWMESTDKHVLYAD